MTFHQCRFRLSVAYKRSVTGVPDLGLNVSCYRLILAIIFTALICILGILVLAGCVYKLMKKKKIEVIPKFIYNSSKEYKGYGNYGSLCLTECQNCLSEYVDGDEIRVFLQSGHGFHVGCIDK
ncbi:RING/U-box superfamily protein [Artemisia annua]|uniref:RING/U-box superfamily protein n=1 Tax=Artemisia annua TaxID=35608 RepID=A0A2U1LTA5_ARTAN|nr:RING/U-box superfamily protein [Artemisia annua]